MPAQEIVGAWVRDCHYREGFRTPYVSYPPTDARPGMIDMIHLTKGGALFRFADRTVTLRGGDIFFFETGTLLERTALPGKPLSFWYVIFTPVGTDGRLSFGKSGLPEVCKPRDSKAVARKLQELASLATEKGPGWRQACAAAMLWVLGNVVPLRASESMRETGPDDRLIEKRISGLLDYINENYKKRLGVRELAARANIHPVHFNRLFRKATGLTPHRYILEKKVAKAKDFLLHYNESLTTTALELGFCDYTHFARVFRKITGTSPRRFLAKA